MIEAPDPPPPVASAFDSALKRRTSWSVMWTILRQLSEQLFSFLVFVILARLLDQAEIGVFALAYVFTEIGRIIAVGGIMQQVARLQDLDEAMLDTLFWMNVAVAVVYAGGVGLAAPLIGDLLDQPQVVSVLQVLALVLPINALGATHFALKLRAFGHKSVALRSLLAGVFGGGAAVAAAFSGLGVWSLVIQRAVTEIVTVLLAWHVQRWVPGRRVSWVQARHALAFGGNLTLAQLVFLMLVRVQDVLIGGALGAAAVGVYRVAWRTSEIIGNGAIQPFASVGLQTFSRLQEDRRALHQAYRAMLASCATLSFPALIGFGVMAPDLVPLIFGEKWHAAGTLAQIFSAMVVPYTLSYFASPVLSAAGESARQRTLALVQLGLTLGLTLLTLPYGLKAVALAYVARAYLTLPLQMRFLKSASGIGARLTLRAIAAPLGCALAMGIAVYLLGRWLDTLALERIFMLAAQIAAGILVYAALLLSFSRVHRRQAIRAASLMRRRFNQGS